MTRLRFIPANMPVFVLAVAVLALFCGAYLNANLADKGALSGTILSEDGKPMVGLALRLERTDPAGMDGAGGGKRRNRTAGWDSGVVGLQAPGGGDKAVKILARVTTDQNGNFLFKDIDAGAALLAGGSKSQGWVYYPVVIEANKEQKLGEIRLAKTD